MTGLAVLTGLVVAVVAYLQVSVPLAGPGLDHADVIYYWPVAVAGGLVVLFITAAVAWLSVRSARRGE